LTATIDSTAVHPLDELEPEDGEEIEEGIEHVDPNKPKMV
jgi:hypothetical protein